MSSGWHKSNKTYFLILRFYDKIKEILIDMQLNPIDVENTKKLNFRQHSGNWHV